MKALTHTTVCSTGASVPAIASGRVSRHRDGENAEIQMYLSKLKDLVPYMPKNKKLSKLDVILNVIDYICDLQTTLESNPASTQFDAQAVLNGLQNQSLNSEKINQHRQPLGIRPSPNTILNNTHSHNNNNIINNNNNNSISSSNLSSGTEFTPSNALTSPSEKSL